MKSIYYLSISVLYAGLSSAAKALPTVGDFAFHIIIPVIILELKPHSISQNYAEFEERGEPNPVPRATMTKGQYRYDSIHGNAREYRFIHYATILNTMF